MQRNIQLALFLTIFTAIYGGMHAYAVGRVWWWLGFPVNIWLVVVIALMTLSFPVANLFEQVYSGKKTSYLYDIAAVWMGSVTILLLVVIILEIVFVFFGVSRQMLYLGLFAWLILIWRGLLVARKPVIRKYTIPADVTRETVLAVASDVHAGPVHGKKYVQKLVELFSKHSPDIIVFPGDLVDGPGKLPEDVLEPLQDVSIPMVYSFGNHEEYVGEENVLAAVQGTGIHVLRNTSKKIHGITFVGIDDAEDQQQVAKVLPGIKKSGYTVLLYHRPDGLEDAAKHGVNLMLSGHTHKGQIFPFTLLVKLRFKRMYGWHEVDETKLYCSSGAGTWGPPMRLGSRSEVILITLTPQQHK